MLFYVDRAIDETCNAVTNVDLPVTHRQLPHWVVPLLEEQLESASDCERLTKNIDAYLAMFQAATVSPAVQFLRRINWASLPLYWQPAYLRNLPIRISQRESTEAQQRLMKNASHPDDSPSVLSEASALLAQITGLDPVLQ